MTPADLMERSGFACFYRWKDGTPCGWERYGDGALEAAAIHSETHPADPGSMSYAFFGSWTAPVALPDPDIERLADAFDDADRLAHEAVREMSDPAVGWAW